MMTSLVLRLWAFKLSLLPRSWALALGALLGRLWFSVIRVRRRVVLDNLARCLPELSSAERKRIALECYRNLGRAAVEFLLAARQPGDELVELVRLEGIEHVEQARAAGHGAIVITGHFGNWDLLCAAAAAAGHPLHVVTKQLSASGFDRFWQEMREQKGVRLLPARGSLTELLDVLKQNEILALVVDQHDPSPSAVVVDFLGRPAAATAAPALLARRTGAPLLPVFAERLPDGTHRARIGEAIECSRTGDLKQDVRETTQRIQNTLEQAVRARPDHWLWLHRRWKAERGRHEIAGA